MDRLTLEVIRGAAAYISEEMGVVLRNTAFSPNIKDRHDHSCAVLAPWGELVAQAEHIPVHIGSMAVGVENALKELRRAGEDLGPGDVLVTNDPYIAGTHLNDVLMIKPVYHQDSLVALVASKAHYVDVGGAVPGSIGGARELIQEGLVIPPVKLVEEGRLNRWLLDVLRANVRTPEIFEGDLRAQLSSLEVGARRVRELAEKYGGEVLVEAWRWILDYTERYTRNTIRDLGVEGSWEAEDYVELQDGSLRRIKVKVTISGGGVEADYTGTDPQVEEPINAVLGVTVAASTFALKTVIDPEMPVNHGFFRAVKVYAPPGTLLNPRPPAPVAAGNTETSQRIVDVVHKALHQALPDRVPAASCGSMTNLMLGGEGWAFYETIACGQGAGPWGDGMDGVHTNMTNTLNTPIERLEQEYPVLFTKYELRPDSEGPGKWRGGLGVVRALKILSEKAVLTVVGERCSTRPWGLHGGRPAPPALYLLKREDGRVERLPCKATRVVGRGDEVIVKTPGGGGYGDPCERSRDLVLKDLMDEKISRERAEREYCWSGSPRGPPT